MEITRRRPNLRQVIEGPNRMHWVRQNRRSRRRTQLTALLLALPLAACLPRGTPARPPASGESSLDAVYRDPQGFFSIRYPSAWYRHRSGSEMQFWADTYGKVRVAVSVKVKATAPERLADEVVGLFRDRFEDYRELSRETTTAGGHSAVRVEQVFEIDGIDQHCSMLAAVRHRVGVLVLGLSPPELVESNKATFDRVIASLRLSSPAEVPDYAVWDTATTTHFVLHAVPSSYAAGALSTIAAQHEAVFAAIGTDLGAAHPSRPYVGPIDLYLYPSDEMLHAATARQFGFAIAEAGEVHVLWISEQAHQSLGHEMTHVIAHDLLGEPSEALLGEGLAVCYDHATPSPHARARAALDAGSLPQLVDLLGENWFETDPDLAYPTSGSFVCWLIETYGIETFGKLYVQGDLESSAPRLYGTELASLEAGWLEAVAGQ